MNVIVGTCYVWVCSGQHRSRAFSWLSRFEAFTQRRKLISPISVGQVVQSSHTCVVLNLGIYSHLPELQRSEAQSA